ncbi:DUF4157 domain-containing protein [Streptomyces sp. NPDC059590]|uniref:eCIS core domain-containing protein n=1 Tax=Streptomyces sp. NPDC059590 TaxID=3346877 RepID=UPI0036B37FB5
MSTSQASAQDDRSAQSAKRRKRKERTANSRTPEPKDIVSGAGQPLDPSVRRELEEQLGHDFSRVRLHTDRDAGQLTELLGADAVAVGQDIFFRENTFRPGTAEGQRLLAHELLHTVQNPHGLGALRAGRDVGAVSVRQDAIEREAEGNAAAPDRAAEVEEGQATPGWLRYTTVDADRHRMEQIDPATLVDRLANSVVRSLRGDPEDRSKRTRMQLARLSDELQDAVLDRLETRLLSSEQERVLDLVDEIEADGDPERESLDAPVVEPDPVEELLFERDTERRTAEEEREEERRPAPAPGPETDQPAEEGAPGSTPQNGGAAEKEGRGGSQEQKRGGSAPGGQSGGQAPAARAAAPQSQQQSASASSSGGKSGGGQQGGGEKKAEGGEKGKEGQDQQGVPTASKEESAAKNRPGAVDSLVAGQQLKQEDKRGAERPTGSPTTSGEDTQQPGVFSTLDGVRNQDIDGPEEKADEDPFASGSESEVDVGGGEQSAWDVKLQPEDFLPAQDLDVSGVPTADRLDPSSSATPPAPSFPAPPVTKADKVQAERDAEDAEDEAAEAEPEEDGAEAVADTEPSAKEDEGGPGGGTLGVLALEQAAETRPGTGAASRDPKSGADPKAGPVDAQVTVQQAAGKSEGGGEAKEQAAKEEKGTPAAGDKSGGAPEKASQQAAGGQAAAQEPAAKEEQKKTDAAPAGKSEPTADAQSPSPARDTQVSGGSNADTPGGASSGAQSEQSPPAERTEAPAEAPAAAPAAKSAPSAPEPKKAAEPEAAAPAPATKGTKPKSAPAAKAPGGGGGGGGGSGGGGGKASAPAKGKKKNAGPAPNLSQVSPEAGLSTASKLKPHVALEAMSGVGGSVDRTVGDEHKALAAAPPSMQRPAGAPQTLQGKPKADAPAQYSQDPAQKSEAPEQEEAEVTGAKEPEGQIEAEKAEEPGGWDTFKMALGFGIGKVLSWVGFKVDAQELAAKFAGLPTKDEALKQAQAGNAPGVQMQGAADQTAGEQGSAVDTKGQEIVNTGRDDAARPMGEDQVYPDAPKEEMAAKVPGRQGGGGGGPGGGASTGAVPPEAASEVAEHERGPQFQAAFSDGRKSMSEGRQAKDRDFRGGQQKHKQQVDAEIDTNTKSQASEREKAMTEVTAKREDWRSEQDKELQSLGDKKTERHEKIRNDVKDKEEQTDKDVGKEKDDSDKKIQDKSDQAERDAEKKRDASVNDSGNWVSKAFNWIKDKVIEIKNAIVRVIREARDAVVNFIKNFKETVERWINDARKAIVDAIKNFINDLIEFAKAMVRAIVDLAKRIRNFITGLINAAIALVNKLANMLKQIITDLLNALGKLLSSILDILKKALQAAVDAVVSAVKAVLDFASQLLNALGAWMLIAVDFLMDPGGWLSGAKNSAVDGAKNHLFREVSSAVKQWFQEKIQEIIGVPKAILDKLINGGYSLDQIVKEAWAAVVPQLPLIIGELVITKVVAKLIPGAGWAMAVIDAIRTAWGALSAILRALGMVLDWLKAVRMGGAGVLFAKAVAAGVVALLETLYQWLLSGIGKYVSKVGKRLKGVAARLGKGKGDKGGAGGKGAGAEGSDQRGDKPGGQKTQQPDPNKHNTPAPARPTTTTTTKPRPATKPDPAKPAAQPSGKPTKADAKTPAPTTKDKNGKPKPTEDRPNTRPTPAAKPKPNPEPPARPKSEPEPKPKPKEDTAPGNKPKDDRVDTRGKPQEDGKDPNKPKTDGKDTPDKPKPNKEPDDKKPKPDKDTPDKPKPRPDKDGPDRTKSRPNKKSPHKPKPRPEKSGPGRPKSKPEKDGRKKEEKQSKDERLGDAVKRIRRILRKRLKPGIPQTAHLQLLGALRQYYRLTSLFKEGSPKFNIRATLNPEEDVLNGFSEEMNDYLNQHSLPDPEIIPQPRMGRRPGQETEATFVNAKWADRNGQAPSGQYTEGWTYVDDHGLNSPGKPQWDRMHLIPRQLGGPAKTSNFVPALNSINGPFYDSFEKFAAMTFGSINKNPENVGWYKVELTRWEGGSPYKYPGRMIDPEKYAAGDYPPGFPKTFTASWGLYSRKPEANGRSRLDWDKFDPITSATLPIPAPPIPGSRPAPVNINTASKQELNTALRETPNFITAVQEVRDAEYAKGLPNRSQPFIDIADMRNKLDTWKSSKGMPLYTLDEAMKRVEERHRAGHFTFS